jgi:histidinol-phosphate/aromatic aminotransferase/cobyric acid decarboxylase-like protein
MSKAFGLAGARIGFAVGAPPLIREIEKAKGPYKVTSPSEQLALGVLKHDVPWVRDRAADAVAARNWLDSRLRELNYEPLPSEANFLLVPVDDARAYESLFADRGILVRAFGKLPPAGRSKPQVASAARTRSRLSLTAAAGSPTMVKVGRPLPRCTSTVTWGAARPACARLSTCANPMRQSGHPQRR